MHIKNFTDKVNTAYVAKILEESNKREFTSMTEEEIYDLMKTIANNNSKMYARDYRDFGNEKVLFDYGDYRITLNKVEKNTSSGYKEIKTNEVKKWFIEKGF